MIVNQAFVQQLLFLFTILIKHLISVERHRLCYMLTVVRTKFAVHKL